MGDVPGVAGCRYAHEVRVGEDRRFLVVPTIAVDGARWAGLSGVSLWPAGVFSLMKAAEVARRTVARLVSTELDGGRLDRLQAMASRRYTF